MAEGYGAALLKSKVSSFPLDFNQVNITVECLSSDFHMLRIH